MNLANWISVFRIILIPFFISAIVYYSPQKDYLRFVALFIFADSILKGKPIEVYNSGKMKRDFTYVADIVAGVVAALDKAYEFEIFNLARGEQVELHTFISEIEKAVGRKAIQHLLPMQPGDVPETWGDITKAFIHVNQCTQLTGTRSRAHPGHHLGQ